jgi:hypothetical protein
MDFKLLTNIKEKLLWVTATETLRMKLERNNKRMLEKTLLTLPDRAREWKMRKRIRDFTSKRKEVMILMILSHQRLK